MLKFIEHYSIPKIPKVGTKIMNLITHIKKLCIQAFTEEFKNNAAAQKLLQNENTIEITEATQEKFGHYQCNSAMKLAKPLALNPKAIADNVKNILEKSAIFSEISVAGPGFLNIKLSTKFIQDLLKEQLQDDRLGVPKLTVREKVIVEYSQPNTAKEMHVGHLRSTIIGDCIARLMDFLGHETLRLNHIGDWGTQFGMLIAYLKEQYPDLDQLKKLHLTLPDLMQIYRKAKLKFDADPDFKKASQLEVVKLQSKEELSIVVWEQICEISRKGYQEIYDILGIHDLLERGESYYNPMLPEIIAKFEAKGLITISEGAKCVYLDGFTNKEGAPLPLIVQKQDSGYNYATTDLAAIYQRVFEEGAKRIIYVVDSGQSLHFQMVFAAARRAKFYDPDCVEIEHIPFGLVLREDGKKFKTRSGDTEKLIDLIYNAINKSRELLRSREPAINETELETTCKILGINAIKYSDLATNRTSDYKFSFDKMLQFEGNTAAFLTYAYVRIKSIMRKIDSISNTNLDTLIKTTNFELIEPDEMSLGLHLLRFPDVIHVFAKDLFPNRLAEYLYNLAEKFHSFFHNCRVEGNDKQNNRLLLCAATNRVLEKGCNILGLTLLDKM